MKKRSGAILIMVLGMLMLMSLLVSLFLSDVVREAQLKLQLAGKDDLRHYAYNALSWVQCHLEQSLSGGKSDTSMVCSPQDLQCPEYIQINIQIEDESGKIPLNNTDTRSLQALFAQFGDVWDAKGLTREYEQWLKRKKVYSQVIEKEMAKPDKPKAKTDTNAKNKKEDDKNTAKDSKDKTREDGKKDPKKHLALDGQNEENQENKNKSQIQFPTELNAYDQLKEIDKFRTCFFDDKGNPKEAWLRLKSCTTLVSKHPVNINAANKDGIEILSKNFSLDVDNILTYLGLNKEKTSEKHTYANLQEINKLGHGHLFFKGSDSKKKKDGENKEENSQNLQRRDCRPFIQVTAHTYRVIIEAKENEVSFILNVLFEVSTKTLTDSQLKDKINRSKLKAFSTVELQIKSLQENVL